MALTVSVLSGSGFCSDKDHSDGVVYYSGPIDKAGVEALLASAKAGPVTKLVITSGGGEVDAALNLASWVFRQQLDVEVSEYCFSSCANYVFPAGDRKIIRKGAVVAWHGNYQHLKQTGLWKDDVSTRMNKYNEDKETAERYVRNQVDRLAGLEQEFFKRIGIDEYLCWIGKMPPYNAPDYYFLSRKDMARFGVTGVETPAGYENTDVSDYPGQIMFIRLQNIKLN